MEEYLIRFVFVGGGIWLLNEVKTTIIPNNEGERRIVTTTLLGLFMIALGLFGING